jgi:glycopeptide antibiotics resistance protein
MEQQLGLWESIVSILTLKLIYGLGAFAVFSFLLYLTRKNKLSSRIRIVVASLLLFYYMSVTFLNVFGIPTLSELYRINGFKEQVFNPNINLIPFREGLSLGFLFPIISRVYEKIKYAFLFGVSISLVIEISQLFTVNRATDIDDLLANSLGTVMGYVVFTLLSKRVRNKVTISFDENVISLE